MISDVLTMHFKEGGIASNSQFLNQLNNLSRGNDFVPLTFFLIYTIEL